ncbi:hypothetical protein JW960_00770 [candidate division KSB1 bacterium]|nr:hypothetical protein [candidate division KSB1 bacterium]
MEEAEKKLTLQWIETWKKAGEAMEQIRKQELQSPEYGKNDQLIDSLLDLAVERGTHRTSTGLVELQQLFANYRNSKLNNQIDTHELSL